MTTPAQPDTGAGAEPDTGSAPEDTTTDAGQQADATATDAPDHAAERFRVLPVMWPRGASGDGAESQVESRLRTLAPDVVADARRNPPADVRRRLRTFRFLDDHEQETFKDLFAGVLRPTR